MTIRQLTSLTFALTLALANCYAFAEDKALLIGVSNYPHLPKLPGIKHDLNNMLKASKHLGFQDKNIKVLSNQNATLNKVKNELSQWLTEDVYSNDRVLIYFSAHGIPVQDQNNDESDGFDEAIALFNSKIIPTNNNQETVTDVLTDDQLGQLIAKIPSLQVYLIVDACHSKSVTRSLKANDDGYFAKTFNYKTNLPKIINSKQTKTNSSNYLQITAAQDDQKALATYTGSVVTTAITNYILSTQNLSEITPKSLFTVAQQAAQNIKKLSLRFNPDYYTLNPKLINHPIAYTANWSNLSNQTDAQHSLNNIEQQLALWQNKTTNPNISININSQSSHTQKTFSFVEGESFKLDIASKTKSQLLLLSINQEQMANVIYPQNLNETETVKHKFSIGGDILVNEPFGTDYIIAIGFTQNTDLSLFVNQEFAFKPQSAKFKLLSEMIATHKNNIDWLSITTKARESRL